MTAGQPLTYEYITELFTPERLDQLRDRLKVLVNDPAYKAWLPFLVMLQQSMAEEDAVEARKGFLVTAFFNEAQILFKQGAEPGEEDSRK